MPLRFRWPALLLAALLAAPAARALDDVGARITRETLLGRVTGVNDSVRNGTLAWKGIPFAKPPVGELRWRAPQDPVPWTGGPALQATQFGNACVQYGRIYGPGANNRHDTTIATTLFQAVGSEDCLYLNVWRPPTTHGSLPVIVFVHGGSNVSGYTADPVYDGAALARTANAVVVTVNYRLGIFGFLNLPQLKTGHVDEDSGNFALLDIAKALRWVNRNIARFGGNPGNVTLMGQSAGAINVYAMMTSPLMTSAAPRLFHRAVAVSGGISLATNLPPGRLATLNPASYYAAQAGALLQQQLIADGLAADAAAAQAAIVSQGPAAIASYLRSRTPAALLGTLLARLTPLALTVSGPIPDGAVLPTDPIAAIAAGNYLRVPLLASTTRDEAKLFPTLLALSPALGGISGRLVTDAQLFNIQFNYNPEAAPTVTLQQWIPAAYLPVTAPGTGFNARTDLLNQLFFIASRDNLLNTLKARQGNVWYYRFDWDEEPAPWNDIYGAAHAFDLPFLFGNFGHSLFSNVIATQANAPGRLELSAAMMKSLGAFALRGDPNHEALGVRWPAWPSTLIFDATPTGKVINVQ